jgi:DMSO/TMAO reductase YedYZ heme-binding membrane subunit
MGDRYVSFPLRAVILPFGGSYEPLLVSFGQIAVWLSLLLIASFHVRRHIGGRVWRRLHYASFVAFWLAVAHGLLLGTNARPRKPTSCT